MPRIKNRNMVPSTPVTWRDPVNGHVVQWKTAAEPFETWVGKVWAYCDGNGRERPSEDTLDQLACQQFPSWACDGQREAITRAPAAPVGRSGGCRSCGGGHR